MECATDILEELGGQIALSLPTESTTDASETDENPLLEALSAASLTSDQLAERLGLTVEELSVRLLAAEMDGHIARLPGGLYQRLFPR